MICPLKEAVRKSCGLRSYAATIEGSSSTNISGMLKSWERPMQSSAIT